MIKKILSNKLLAITLVVLLFLFIIVVIFFLTKQKTQIEPPSVKIYTKEEHVDALSFPETQRVAVRSVYESEYAELKKNIPPEADFTVAFNPDGPLLTINFPAKTFREFYDKKQAISLFLVRFNINPCIPPISNAVSWEARDWSIIKPDSTTQDHSCDELISFYEKLKSTNPLVQYLPYAVDGFNIYYTVTDSSALKTSYNITINIPADLSAKLKTRQEIFDELQKQKSLALDWIRLKGFDPAKLDIRMPELDINQIPIP